jgi:thiamine-phosphate pyrophosphorylase
MIDKLPRFYPILDTGVLDRVGLSMVGAGTALLDAGVKILQVRHKEHFDRKTFEAARDLAARCRGTGALLVINDRADVAVLLDAGLHVGQDDLPAPQARSLIGQGRMLGLSTHNEAQLLASNAEPVDYAAIGPMFETGSKRNPDPRVGAGELARLRSMTMRPVVAIGGITLENCGAVLQGGADSVAVIGGLFPAGCTAASLRRRAEEWMRVTDAY